MTVTIHFSPDLEKKLLARAAAIGKPIDALVQEAVEEKLRDPQTSFEEILAPIHEDFRKSGMTDKELADLLQQALTDHRKSRRQSRGEAP